MGTYQQLPPPPPICQSPRSSHNNKVQGDTQAGFGLLPVLCVPTREEVGLDRDGIFGTRSHFWAVGKRNSVGLQRRWHDWDEGKKRQGPGSLRDNSTPSPPYQGREGGGSWLRGGSHHTIGPYASLQLLTHLGQGWNVPNRPTAREKGTQSRGAQTEHSNVAEPTSVATRRAHRRVSRLGGTRPPLVGRHVPAGRTSGGNSEDPWAGRGRGSGDTSGPCTGSKNGLKTKIGLTVKPPRVV